MPNLTMQAPPICGPCLELNSANFFCDLQGGACPFRLGAMPAMRDVATLLTQRPNTVHTQAMAQFCSASK